MTINKNYWLHINEGDDVMIHSSLSRTCKTLGVTPSEVLESLIDAVGPEGTLIFPVFNFSTFNKGKTFDYLNTPSEMGILSETARTWPGAMRNMHPISGWVAIGKHAHLYCEGGYIHFKHAYKNGSPLTWAYNRNIKIAILDLNAQAAITFYHFVEQRLGVDWRYSKEFESDYIGPGGKLEKKSFELYVKHGWAETDADPMDNILWALGLYKGDLPGLGTGMRIIRAQALYDALSLVMKHSPNKGEGLIWRKVEEVH